MSGSANRAKVRLLRFAQIPESITNGTEEKGAPYTSQENPG